MEGWQMCSLLLTINADSTPGEQQHSDHPLFIKTFLFNIASVTTQHLKPHQSSLNILHKPWALVSIWYWYAILPKLVLSWFAYRHIVWNCLPLEKMKNYESRGENGEFWAGAEGGGKRERGENRGGGKTEGKRKLP